ncbi:MAG TPA: hypothetical protein DCL41_06020 [Bdellovibrionales bacterium]|nr:hypothetical protein [Pseudobdellovibrionaceae bacterium]HAG91407.1 hypothetical protein [Bdellovibrionales bacterium]|tara:strand:+ start:3413 stop:4528 length:1116 start_codon:yes stop_codon:yes gene_type:complete
MNFSTFWRLFFFSPLVMILMSCSSTLLKYEKEEQLNDIGDYEKRLEVKEIEEPKEEISKKSSDSEGKPKDSAESAKDKSKKESAKKSSRKKSIKKAPRKEAQKDDKKSSSTPKKNVIAKKRLPEMEDSVGFDGRRPEVDPFRVGEKVTLDVTYFNIKAGEIHLQVKPFVEVNGHKAYNFQVDLKSYSLFSHIYSVDDQATTYVDYEELKPYNLSITIKESKQLAETRTLFDWDKMKAFYWKKRYTEDNGEEKKELSWDIKDYSQNVISALYYLRNFQMEPGKKLAFRVADEGNNIEFTGEVLRREVLKTKIGKLKTLVIRPQIQVDGAFKPMGENLIWITDDDRKFIVRIESKIKIGTLVAKLKSIDKGRD